MLVQDQFICHENGVSVTTTLVRIDEASYSVANIGSVLVRKAHNVLAALIAIIAGLALIGEISDTLQKPSPVDALLSETMTIFVTLAIFLICGAASLKPKYHLIFRTSSSDQRALSSRDGKMISDVQAAIESAITQRG